MKMIPRFTHPVIVLQRLGFPLAEAGRRLEAIIEAERAASLGGPTEAVSRATLAEIKQTPL